MKKKLKNKKFVLGLIVSIILIIAIVFELIIINQNDKTEEKILHEKNYTMFVKINPLVKLTFDENYYTCNNKKCSEIKTKVTSLKLVNDNAKDMFRNIDLNGISIEKAIDTITEVYKGKKKENKIDVKITTNWTNYKEYKLATKIQIDNVKLNIDFQKKIDEEKLYESENVNTFTVTFDSNGGNIIEKEKVVEGESVIMPATPKKKGYVFVEWQLNNLPYDFTNEVKRDITLKAKWELEEKEEDKKEEENKKNTEQKEEVQKPNNVVNNKEENNKVPSNNNENKELEKDKEQDKNKEETNDNKNNTNEENKEQNKDKVTLKENEYIKVSDGKVHKYSFHYENKAECISNAQGDTPYDTVYSTLKYWSLGCDEIKDENDKKLWGIYFHVYVNEEDTITYY